MANTSLTATVGDYGADATLAFTLTDPDGTFTSLAARTINLVVFIDPAHPLFTGTCTFDTGMRFHYVPLITDYSQAGQYEYRINISGIATGKLTGSIGHFTINA